jgi:hypothetical protein
MRAAGVGTLSSGASSSAAWAGSRLLGSALDSLAICAGAAGVALTALASAALTITSAQAWVPTRLALCHMDKALGYRPELRRDERPGSKRIKSAGDPLRAAGVTAM